MAPPTSLVIASTAPLSTIAPEVSFAPLVRVSARNGISSAMVSASAM